MCILTLSLLFFPSCSSLSLLSPFSSFFLSFVFTQPLRNDRASHWPVHAERRLRGASPALSATAAARRVHLCDECDAKSIRNIRLGGGKAAPPAALWLQARAAAMAGGPPQLAQPAARRRPPAMAPSRPTAPRRTHAHTHTMSCAGRSNTRVLLVLPGPPNLGGPRTRLSVCVRAPVGGRRHGALPEAPHRQGRRRQRRHGTPRAPGPGKRGTTCLLLCFAAMAFFASSVLRV